MQNHFHLNRRAFLGRYAGALGSLALAEMLAAPRVARASSTAPANTGKAKAVICLFQHGGPSQMDLFDEKPELTRHDGQPYPGELEVHFHEQKGNLLASPFKFAPAGQCGMPLSEILPHMAGVADELTLVRSMTTESV